MTWRKLNFQKFKEGRKERLNLGDLRSGCRTQQIRETDQWMWCPEDRHESMHHCLQETWRNSWDDKRSPSQRRIGVCTTAGSGSRTKLRASPPWHKGTGLYSRSSVPHDYRLSPSVRRPDYSSKYHRTYHNEYYISEKASVVKHVGKHWMFLSV